jgi:inorganic pyrophosphatase
MASLPLPVYIEIEKGSNVKYEFDQKTQSLQVDRVLDTPTGYPFAYGFFPNTLADDGDELDVLIIRKENTIRNDRVYPAHIIGALVMEDEKGMDEKVLCVLEEDYEQIQDITDLDSKTKDEINTFFSTYKLNSPGRWSKTFGFLNHQQAIQLYAKSLPPEVSEDSLSERKKSVV